MTPSPTQSDAFTALRAFLTAIMPPNTEVLQTQVNKVSEPEGDDFVLMTPSAQTRLATNRETQVDCGFVGSISGNVMTVTSMITGTIVPGTPGPRLFGIGLVQNPTIIEQITGTAGGVGTYRLSDPQPTPLASQTLACGILNETQETLFEVQLDVHGPNSADNAQTITNLMRSPYATQFFADLPSSVSPLHADDARQMPFINDQNQYENRWTIQAMLQIDQTVAVPQQYMNAASVVLVSVDKQYPP